MNRIDEASADTCRRVQLWRGVLRRSRVTDAVYHGIRPIEAIVPRLYARSALLGTPLVRPKTLSSHQLRAWCGSPR